MKKGKAEQQGLKILKAEIKNFKQLTHLDVDFGGRSATIMGKNEVGKSGFIQAICSSLDASVIPMEPIQEGEERAQVEIKIGGVLGGEMVQYTLATYFTEANKKGRVVIMDGEDTVLTGGRNLIDSIVGNIGFDIFEFIKLGKTPQGRPSEKGVREQIDILKELMPLEGLEALHEVEVKATALADERSSINTDIKYLTENLKHDLSDEEIEKFSKKKDAQPIKDKMSKIGDEIEAWNLQATKKKKCDEYVREAPGDIESIEKEIKELQDTLAESKRKLAKAKISAPIYAKYFVDNPEKPSISKLQEELEGIASHNSSCDIVKELDEMNEALRDNKERYEAKGLALKEIKNEKKEVFSKFPLPVANLEFDENTITYKGLPLNGEQINTASLIGIGVKISMAMNPNLRLMIIKDGSLLDASMTKTVLKMCDKYDYQLLIEKVSEDQSLTINFVEESDKN